MDRYPGTLSFACSLRVARPIVCCRPPRLPSPCPLAPGRSRHIISTNPRQLGTDNPPLGNCFRLPSAPPALAVLSRPRLDILSDATDVSFSTSPLPSPSLPPFLFRPLKRDANPLFSPLNRHPAVRRGVRGLPSLHSLNAASAPRPADEYAPASAREGRLQPRMCAWTAAQNLRGVGRGGERGRARDAG